MLDEADFATLTAFRRRLHAVPELSGEEAGTAAAVEALIADTGPDELVTGLGGHGVAAVYRGATPGPTLLFRADLDALPIEEADGPAHRSTITGRAHLCGHDGHTATLAAMGIELGRQRPARGRAVLLFQPAEETGRGAGAVIADPQFAALTPDLCFAWHNMPGLALGEAALAEGPVNCASRGMRIRLVGSTAHASQPEQGRSPMQAMVRLMPALTALARGDTADPDFALVTVTHARLGEPAFGIAPGLGEIWATLRTLTTAAMVGLCAEAEALAHETAGNNLAVTISYDDIFDHCENAPEAVAYLRQALDADGIPHDAAGLPMRGSEDFGRFGQIAPSAMFLLGAGQNMPGLHTPCYDFPDALIPIGARIMLRTLRQIIG